MDKDITIIGAGIIGLSTAYQILDRNPRLKVRILEKENEVAAHQTGNNSGVLHSGIYYRPGSLKAKNCVNGYRQLLDFCDRNEVDYDICGKIIVATTKEEIPGMEILFNRGQENGLSGLRMLKKEELKEFEPHVSGLGGIHVPQTGIIDFKKVSEKLASIVIRKGGTIHFGSYVTDIKTKNGRIMISTKDQTFESRLVINCAGLYSDRVTLLTKKDIDVRIIPFRGEYYKIVPDRQYLVKNLIYPVPDPNFPFLGVHFTRMIDGGIEAGPNAVLAFAREGYQKSNIHPVELLQSLTWPGFLKVARRYWRTGLGEMYRSYSKAAFTKALQQLVPEIGEKDLVTGGAGVRAQACDRKGHLLDDFLIYENDRAINVCNAPSPAATSCLAIGETIAGIAFKRVQ